MLNVDMAAKGAGERDAVDRRNAIVIHQQAHTSIERGLAELDGAHVVLGDGDARLALSDQIAKGPPVGLDTGACGRRACRLRRHQA